MADRAAKGGSGGRTLGQYLASIRADRKLTLRDVEDQTKREVSNAYLSQIETGKIQQPSPQRGPRISRHLSHRLQPADGDGWLHHPVQGAQTE